MTFLFLAAALAQSLPGETPPLPTAGFQTVASRLAMERLSVSEDRRDQNAIVRISGDSAPGDSLVRLPTQITLRATRSDVRETLRNLFRQTGTSYSISPDVQGTVTVDLRNATFETALGSVLRQVNATYQEEAGVIHIVPRDPRNITVIPSNNWTAEPPIVIQDNKYLYLISSGKIVKVRKSDIKVEKEGTIPLQWGNRFQGFGGEF